MKQHMMNTRSGFTLLELSISLVIIGLIAGSVLVGRELINSAAVRATIAQKEKFETGVQVFTEKYNCIPGDCDHATDFWPARADCNNSSGVSSTIVACNGDGNNRIGPNGHPDENIFFWEHLSNAQLIPGSFNGADYFNTSDGSLADSTLPAAKIPSARFSVVYAPAFGVFQQGYGLELARHVFIIGKYPSEETYAHGSVIKPADAFAIDSKVDDGFPDTGLVTRWAGYNMDLSEGTTSSNPRIYDVTHPNNKCAMVWNLSF